MMNQVYSSGGMGMQFVHIPKSVGNEGVYRPDWLEDALDESPETSPAASTGGDKITLSREGRALADSMRLNGEDAPESDGKKMMGARQGGRPQQAQSSGESSSSEDLIDRLEQEIEQLEEEVEALQARAATDENAKEQLNAKRIELASKQAELAELESEQE